MKKILPIALLLMLAAACSKSSAPPTRAARVAVAPVSSVSNQPAWNWDSYPAVKKMRLGMLPCTLQPRSQIMINSTLAGALKLYMTAPQTNLDAGAVWGEFEPSIFQAEADALEEARVKLDEREKLQRDIEIPRARLKLQRDLEEAQRRVKMIRLLSTNAELAQLTVSAGDNKSLLRPDSLTDAEEELRLIDQNLEYLHETNSAVLTMDIGTLRSQWRQQKLEFERRRAQATLKMPFSGQLTLTLPLAEGVAEYPVNIGQELGVARDLSTVRVRVPFANSAWSALPPERLFAIVRLPSGQELEAQFAYNKVERVQNREESAYYFQFLPEHTATVARLIGTDVTCELWLNLGQVTRIVPKLALIMHNPTAFQSGNWSAGLSQAFPGTRLAVEGQTDLGVILPIKPVIASAR
jgi:hypothetical protein